MEESARVLAMLARAWGVMGSNKSMHKIDQKVYQLPLTLKHGSRFR